MWHGWAKPRKVTWKTLIDPEITHFIIVAWTWVLLWQYSKLQNQRSLAFPNKTECIVLWIFRNLIADPNLAKCIKHLMDTWRFRMKSPCTTGSVAKISGLLQTENVWSSTSLKLTKEPLPIAEKNLAVYVPTSQRNQRNPEAQKTTISALRKAQRGNTKAIRSSYRCSKPKREAKPAVSLTCWSCNQWQRAPIKSPWEWQKY